MQVFYGQNAKHDTRQKPTMTNTRVEGQEVRLKYMHACVVSLQVYQYRSCHHTYLGYKCTFNYCFDTYI